MRTNHQLEDEISHKTLIRLPQSSEEPSVYHAMISGGLAGCVAKTCTAPLSRLTILYQVNALLNKGSTKPTISSIAKVQPIHTHSFSMLKDIYQLASAQGVSSLWKGNLTSVIHRFPYSAINFGAFEILRSAFIRKENNSESIKLRFLCGAASGAVACSTCYPLDLVKTRLTVDIPHNHTSNNTKISAFSSKLVSASKIFGILLSIVREEGVRGLYRGLSVSLLVTVPNLAIGYSTYGVMKEFLMSLDKSIFIRYNIHDVNNSSNNNNNGNSGKLNSIGALVSGSAAGIMSSIVTFPIDTIRRRLQVAGMLQTPSLTQPAHSISVFPIIENNPNVNVTSNTTITSTNTTTTINITTANTGNTSAPLSGMANDTKATTRSTQTLHNPSIRSSLSKLQIIRGLYRGITPELVKVAPMVGITFCVYEYTMDFLQNNFV
eukprot:gene4578-6452_t